MSKDNLAFIFHGKPEVDMLVTANTSYVKMRIQGAVSESLLAALKLEYGGSMRLIREMDDNVQDWSQIGKAVRVYRVSFGWTQAQLGRKLEVPAGFVSDLEHGRRMVSKQTAKELAKIFGVSMAHFV
jgi:ribosome-binding protein aMBF1 (putative translation factor)